MTLPLLVAARPRSRRGEAPARVSDEVVALFAAIGRHDQIARRIEERFGGISDAVITSTADSPRADLPPDLIRDLQRIPCRFAGFDAGRAAGRSAGWRGRWDL